MRANFPVTEREYVLPEQVTLMSTTDPQGRIRYANAAFVEASGFSREELIGQPHNLVRHPDMPEEAFADMWATLKSGHSWSALVKNRRKDGDYYWVRANATVLQREGQIVGFVSVRTKPEAEEVRAAEALYARMRAGRNTGWRMRHGLLLRQGLWAWTSALRLLSARARLRGAFGVQILALGALAYACGLSPQSWLVFVGAAALLAWSACAWLELQLSRPLQRLLEQARALAAGQSAAGARFERVDEIGLIQQAINQSGLNLRSLVDDVAEQLGSLQAASGSIRSGHSELNARTEQTAANLQQTAAAMEEMTATVQQNAESAQRATELAQTTRHAAAAGGGLMQQVVQTMGEIHGASSKISDIVALIDSLAFQTNILALNAAVEAARAGHQGRGFAVVAAEVRALAQRSAQAAQQIKQQLAHSSSTVTQGHQLVGQAAESIGHIVEQVHRVGELIDGISAATRDQSEGIGQVNLAVNQLDRMTQQNAGLVVQGSTSALHLTQLAKRLLEAIALYRDDAAPSHGERQARALRPPGASPTSSPLLAHGPN
ncbi:methyl-accepting chemotaxis protein [Roseateles sp. PN1]|uniref:methyl-accepting chemotaxis protein n=1 Tax=Roseateles sp. PN1 TaxID=3137372 RepID=UPI0031393CBE